MATSETTMSWQQPCHRAAASTMFWITRDTIFQPRRFGCLRLENIAYNLVPSLFGPRFLLRRAVTLCPPYSICASLELEVGTVIIMSSTSVAAK